MMNFSIFVSILILGLILTGFQKIIPDAWALSIPFFLSYFLFSIAGLIFIKGKNGAPSSRFKISQKIGIQPKNIILLLYAASIIGVSGLSGALIDGFFHGIIELLISPNVELVIITNSVISILLYLFCEKELYSKPKNKRKG